MNTKTGRKIAEERHNYMVDFLKQFYAEWHGEKQFKITLIVRLYNFRVGLYLMLALLYP